jgi:hypothetical protein
MEQYRFWITVTVDGVPQRKEYVFDANNWTEARQMLSEAMKALA